jgi:hypothetical protein
LIWTNCATYCAHAVKQGNIDHETSVSLPEQAGSLFQYVKELVEDHQEKERYVKPVVVAPWQTVQCKHVLGYLWVPVGTLVYLGVPLGVECTRAVYFLGVECTRAVYLCPVDVLRCFTMFYDVLRCFEYNHKPILMSFCVQDGGTAADV